MLTDFKGASLSKRIITTFSFRYEICSDLHTMANSTRNITVGETNLRNPTGRKYREINRWRTSFTPGRGDTGGNTYMIYFTLLISSYSIVVLGERCSASIVHIQLKISA